MQIGRYIRDPDMMARQMNCNEHEARDTFISRIFSLMKSRMKGGSRVSSPSLKCRSYSRSRYVLSLKSEF